MIPKLTMQKLLALHEAVAAARETYALALSAAAKQANVRKTALNSVVSATAKQREAEIDATAQDVLRLLAPASAEIERLYGEASEPAA